MAENTAQEIVDTIGGPGNIASLTHCATRLRFELNDNSIVDKAAMESIPGVMGAVPQSGNRYQVIIGGGVQSVYNDIQNLPVMATAGAAPSASKSDADLKADLRNQGVRGKFSWLDSFFEFLSDSFRPILGVLLGASLIIAIAAVLDALGVVEFRSADKGASWFFYDTMWRGVFYFLPIMVAYNGAKKLNVDPWLGAAIMGALMTPEFTDNVKNAANTTCTTNATLGTDQCVAHIFGLPLQMNDYSGQVFVPLLMVGLLAVVYKMLKKIFPENLQMVFVPFFSLLIMVPLTAFILGPIGVWAGNGLGSGLSYMNNHWPIVFAIVIPLLYPFLVPLGLHWPLNALMLMNIKTLGYDFIQGPMGTWNFACFGATAAVLALSLKDKDKEMQQTASGALAAGLLGGISEPSLYGIHLRFKRIYPSMLAGCLAGGITIGVLGGVTTNAFAFTSLLTIPVFSPMWKYAISVLIAFVVSMAVVMIRGYKDPVTAAVTADGNNAALAGTTDATVGRRVADAAAPAATVGAAAATTGAAAAADAGATTAAAAVAKSVKPAMEPDAVTVVTSPLAGRVMPLSEVPDAAFAAGVVGKGVGIDPSGDTVYAPAAGKVVVAMDSGHAVGLSLDSGVELLVHVGIDTVQMGGNGFQLHVAKGDRVEAGSPLITFDRAAIEAAGYSAVTPVLVTNPKKFATVTPLTESGEVAVGDPLVSTTGKPAKLES